MNNRPYGAFQQIADEKAAVGFFIWQNDYKRTLALPSQYYKLYRPDQITQLFIKTRAKKCFNRCVRFLIRTNQDIIFAEEGGPHDEIPAHGQMTEDNKKISISAQCLSAGNIYFNDQDEITEISCKSGDFRPSIDSLQFALDAIFANKMKVSNTIGIKNGLDRTIYSIPSSEARFHYLKYRARKDGPFTIETNRASTIRTRQIETVPQLTQERPTRLNQLRAWYQGLSRIKRAAICIIVGLFLAGLIFSIIGFFAGLATGALFVALTPLFTAPVSATTISMSIVGTTTATSTSTYYYLMKDFDALVPTLVAPTEERLQQDQFTNKAPCNDALESNNAPSVIDHARQAFRYILF